MCIRIAVARAAGDRHVFDILQQIIWSGELSFAQMQTLTLEKSLSTLSFCAEPADLSAPLWPGRNILFPSLRIL